MFSSRTITFKITEANHSNKFWANAAKAIFIVNLINISIQILSFYS
jgi:hypothetical protein